MGKGWKKIEVSSDPQRNYALRSIQLFLWYIMYMAYYVVYYVPVT